MKKTYAFLALTAILATGAAGLRAADAPGTIPRLTFAQAADTQAIEPYNGTSTPSATIVFQMFNALTRTDAEGKVVGDLAESFKSIDDDTWEFKLRKDVKFHNGEEFNAASVKYSVERMLAPENKFRLAADFQILKDAAIVDPYTVRISTKEPFAGLPLRLIYLAMVPAKYAQEKGADFGKAPVGTGPFKFKEYVKDDHVTLVNNPGYFRGASKIKELVFRPIPEEASRVAALEAGEVDLVTGVSSSQVDRLKKNADLNVAVYPTTRAVYIAFDVLNNPVTKNKLFRQALNYAVDVDSIIKNVLDGRAKRISTIFLSHFDGYAADVAPYPYDPAKAKALLAQAGYKGEALTLALVPGAGNASDVVQAVADQLRKVGVNASVQEKEDALFRSELAGAKPAPLFYFTFGGPYNCAEMISRVAFGTKQRYSAYWNAEMDALRVKASGTLDPVKAAALWKEFQVKFKDDAPAVFLYQQYAISVYSKKIKNYVPRKDELVLFDGVSY